MRTEEFFVDIFNLPNELPQQRGEQHYCSVVEGPSGLVGISIARYRQIL